MPCVGPALDQQELAAWLSVEVSASGLGVMAHSAYQVPSYIGILGTCINPAINQLKFSLKDKT